MGNREWEINFNLRRRAIAHQGSHPPKRDKIKKSSNKWPRAKLKTPIRFYYKEELEIAPQWPKIAMAWPSISQ